MNWMQAASVSGHHTAHRRRQIAFIGGGSSGVLMPSANARTMHSERLAVAVVAIAAVGSLAASAGEIATGLHRSIEELTPTATIRVGKTADWVAISDHAVWVGSSGPDAVSEIDPHTNRLVSTIPLPGNPCAGLAIGHGGVWVPLCARPNAVARIDLRTRKVTLVAGIGPAASEGGITSSSDSVWLIVDRKATLARIDPASGHIRQTIHVPSGSYNPLYSAGLIWVTRAEGAEVTVVQARTGNILGRVRSGPNPRFLTSGAGAVWTLNQGDGSLSRIDMKTRRVVQTIALDTPGHGGDIKFGGGMVWTSMSKVPLTVVDGRTGVVLCQWMGPGGDALGIGHGAIWLTNYHAGTISRIEMREALSRCSGTPVKSTGEASLRVH
jgi:virginiamycin B lyase